MKTLLVLILASLTTSTFAASTYPQRLDDPGAVYLTPQEFHVHGDGQQDDSEAVQAAIDKLQSSKGEGHRLHPARPLPHQPHHLSLAWRTTDRLRPAAAGLRAGRKYPGLSGRHSLHVLFRGRSPPIGGLLHNTILHPTPAVGTVPPIRNVPDANPGTFYSAISNVDFEIGPGNSGAVAIRFHSAQHSFLSHIDFSIGSGLAGVHEVANEAEDLHFHGGQYGILARKPSPAWQFTLIDSTFDGQREAAIRENEAGLTLVHDEFRNLPTAVSIDPHYSDQLWIKDTRFENITGPAVIISNDASRMTEINFENVLCQHVPIFAKLRESGREFRQTTDTYQVSVFSHGLSLAFPGAAGRIPNAF